MFKYPCHVEHLKLPVVGRYSPLNLRQQIYNKHFNYYDWTFNIFLFFPVIKIMEIKTSDIMLMLIPFNHMGYLGQLNWHYCLLVVYIFSTPLRVLLSR